MKKMATIFIVAAAMFSLSSCSQNLTTEEENVLQVPQEIVVYESTVTTTTITNQATAEKTTKAIEHAEKELAVPLKNLNSNLAKDEEQKTTSVVNTTEKPMTQTTVTSEVTQTMDENYFEKENNNNNSNSFYSYSIYSYSIWQNSEQEVTQSENTWGQTQYTVKAGDCWSTIAESHGIWPPDVLAKANGVTISDAILPGDTIIIPSVYEVYNESQPSYQNDYQNDYNTNQYDWYQPSGSWQSYNTQSGNCIGSSWLATAPDWASWTNITVSLNYLNGLTLAPGEYFNWDNYIGYMTADETNIETVGSNPYGYVKAPVFIGTENGYEVGGGICVTSTALFQAARNAGMSIIERHDHSKRVGYAVPGDEASVSYGELNLVFANTTGNTVVFYTSYEYGGISVNCYIA